MQYQYTRPVVSFWPSYEESLNELITLSHGIDGLKIDKQEIIEKIRKIREGRAKKHKDHKRLVAFENDNLWEARWQFSSNVGMIQIRLIYEDMASGELLLLRWHVKNPQLTQDQQRAAQNDACQEAINRKDTFIDGYRLDL